MKVKDIVFVLCIFKNDENCELKCKKAYAYVWGMKSLETLNQTSM